MTTARNDRASENALLSAVQAAGSILLFSHVSPDGDTLGSALALKIRLERMGKRTQMVMDGALPDHLRFLPEAERIMRPETADDGAWALALAVDVSCEERLGAAREMFLAAKETALIDHHATNPGFAEINVIDGDAPATAVLVHRLFQRLPGEMSREEAICLYTALSTDTGNFIYESTNAESFRMMASLLEAGLPLAECSRALFREKEHAFVELLGQALPTLRVSCSARVAGLRLSLAQMQAAHANAADAEGVVDYAIDIRGVKMAYFVRETDDGRVKASLRALKPCRVDEIAARFGGGGHRLAAGCTLSLPLEEAAQAIEKALAEACETGAQA